MGHHCYTLVFRFHFSHSLSPNCTTFSLVPQGTMVPEDLAVGKRKETVLLWLSGKHPARQNFIAVIVLPGYRLQDWYWNSKRIYLQSCNGSGVGSGRGPRTCDMMYHPLIIKPFVTPCSCTFQAFKGWAHLQQNQKMRIPSWTLQPVTSDLSLYSPMTVPSPQCSLPFSEPLDLCDVILLFIFNPF